MPPYPFCFKYIKIYLKFIFLKMFCIFIFIFFTKHIYISCISISFILVLTKHNLRDIVPPHFILVIEKILNFQPYFIEINYFILFLFWFCGRFNKIVVISNLIFYYYFKIEKINVRDMFSCVFCF
jgi:hypothetical protein